MDTLRFPRDRASSSTIALRRLTLVGAVALGSAALALGGCNTTKGMGKDLEETGENIQDAAEKAKDELSD